MGPPPKRGTFGHADAAPRMGEGLSQLSLLPQPALNFCHERDTARKSPGERDASALGSLQSNGRNNSHRRRLFRKGPFGDPGEGPEESREVYVPSGVGQLIADRAARPLCGRTARAEGQTRGGGVGSRDRAGGWRTWSSLGKNGRGCGQKHRPQRPKSPAAQRPPSEERACVDVG